MKQADAEIVVWPARFRRLALAVRLGWLEFLAASPVLLWIAAYVYKGGEYAWVWVLGLALYTVTAGLVATLPFLRWTGVQLVCNAVLITGWSWLLHGIGVEAVLSVLAGILLSVRASQLVRYGDEAKTQAVLLWMGLAVCAPAAFFFHRVDYMDAYSGGLTVIAVLLLASSLIMSNTSSLAAGAYGARNASASGRTMRRFNKTLVLLLGLPVLAVSFWGLVDQAVRQAAKWVLRALDRLLPGISPPVDQPAPAPAQEAPQPQLPPEGKPALIWVVLEYVMMAALAAGAAVLLFLVLRALARRLPGWLRTALGWLAKSRTGGLEEDTGYTDEVTSTRDNKAGSGNGPWKRLKRLFQGEPGPRWEDLATNGERLRFLYARAVRRSIRAGFRWKPHWTPKETALMAAQDPEAARRLQPELCEAYERVRYGGLEPDDEETALLRSKVEN